MHNKEAIAQYFQTLQDSICQQLEQADGEGTFQEDKWERAAGGGGRTRIIQGRHIEKGGVNFSAVHGPMPEKISKALGLNAGQFFASGVSIVLHPKSPMVPIIHMNVRYFEMDNGTWWFGGGIDLTPHYIVKEDARYFHQELKKVCDRHHADYYPTFKKWADDYFFLKHRDETRGIGGIFFDRLSANDEFSKEDRFAFVKEVGELFAPLYVHLLHKHKADAYSEAHKQWQALRRGRYVEFNLVWDKGTKFGLDTNGRTESILMSLPPDVKWMYNHVPEAGSAEAQTLELLKKDIDWINI
ncbi:MAG: oxygen-dependent coproporphyrinogen oxidase [Saprospiraceae bacterium]|nr:oxygen-dependent coproporphyrinogen oxidase [Saprospiraceae bacterium]